MATPLSCLSSSVGNSCCIAASGDSKICFIAVQCNNQLLLAAITRMQQ